MKLVAFLTLVLGLLGLMWISDENRVFAPVTANVLPTKAFEPPEFCSTRSPIRRVLDGWNIRHYRQVRGEFRREWEVHGETVAMDAAENAFVLRPVVLFCEYPKGGGDPRMITFHADTGRYTKGMETVRLEGDVRVRSADGSELAATDLISSLEKKDLRALGQVHLRHAGLDFRGTGFTSDTQLTNIELDRAVKVEMRSEGRPAAIRPRAAGRARAVKTTLDATIITCLRRMAFKRLTKPEDQGPARYQANFEGDVQLLRDVPGVGTSRLSCDALEVFVVEVVAAGKPTTTAIERLAARGRVHVEDAEGELECDLLLIDVIKRENESFDVATLSGRHQRIVVKRTTGARGLPGAGDALSGRLEATCSGPLVIERRTEPERRTKAFFRQSVYVSQPGSLILADEFDLVLLPSEGATGLSEFEARGNVHLQSGAKVAFADRLVWNRATQTTTLTSTHGVEVVQEDRRIRSKDLTLVQGEKGERILATGNVSIETPDLSASGERLNWDPNLDRMEIVGPRGGVATIWTPDISASGARIDWDRARDRMEVVGSPNVVVAQEGSTIQCRSFLLMRGERRMIAEGGVWMHFIDDPAKGGKTRAAVPMLPGGRTKPGEKREADLWCERQEFTWREDGGMERMVSTGDVTIESGATKVFGSRFDWDAAAGAASLDGTPWAIVESAGDASKSNESPARFYARRIRFTSTGLLLLQGPKLVQMEREVVDENGARTREPITAVCERDLLIQNRGKELFLDRNVRVTSGDSSIHCDRMRVFTDPETGRMSKLIAWGRVRYRSADGMAIGKQMEWSPETRATDLRSLPPAIMVDPEGRLFYAEHITISDHGKRMMAENEYRRRDIWLPGKQRGERRGETSEGR